MSTMLMSYRTKARNGHEAWPKDDWDDSSTAPGSRNTYKRLLKRRERQNWKREIAR